VDPSRIDALSKTLAVGMWNLSFGESVSVIRTLKSGQFTEIDKSIPALKLIQKKMLHDGAVGGVIHCAEDSGFTSLISSDPSFVYVWKAIVTLAESLARDGDIDNPTELMKVMLAYRLSAESKTVKVSVGAPDYPIKAMTAHGSKGLEFDYVFMPYTNEETWIGRHKGSSFVLPEKNLRDHDVRDIRRLFYVGLTRARKHATILSSLEESDGKALTPLRFIEELHKDRVLVTNLSRTELSQHKKKNEHNSEYDGLMISETKRVLLESGLSVTALNHFLECPSKFIYESILKLPQAPSVSAEKGSAVHDALSEVWRQKEKEANKIEKIITTRIVDFVDKSMLSINEKEALKGELLENAPAVASSLSEHFSTQGVISTERWVKFPYDGIYNKDRVTVPIHGKLDVIIDKIDKADVFDYKTRQKMSVEAIKGETKNDDGNYFRQLVYYKLLLQNNREWRNKEISTSLVFVSPDDKGRCPIITIPVTDVDVRKVKEEIQFVIDSVWSGKILKEYCSDRDCRYCGYRRIIETKK